MNQIFLFVQIICVWPAKGFSEKKTQKKKWKYYRKKNHKTIDNELPDQNSCAHPRLGLIDYFHFLLFIEILKYYETNRSMMTMMMMN